MANLLKKEFSLAMHPITPLMVILSAMVLIPNYPYVIIFFYSSMSIFFTCLLGRENKDIVYSLNLPVGKRNIVKARFAFTIIIQLAQITVMVPFVLLSRLFNQENLAGMDGNITLFAIAFIVCGLFNLVFFHVYYKNVNKVGVAFVAATVVMSLCMVADVVSTYAVPFVRDCLDTRDPEFLSYKLIALAMGIAVYIVLTVTAYVNGAKNFEKQDLN